MEKMKAFQNAILETLHYLFCAKKGLTFKKKKKCDRTYHIPFALYKLHDTSKMAQRCTGHHHLLPPLVHKTVPKSQYYGFLHNMQKHSQKPS